MLLRCWCFFVLIILVLLAGVALLYAPRSKEVPEYGHGNSATKAVSQKVQSDWPCSPDFHEPVFEINDSLISHLLDMTQLPIRNVHKLSSRRRLFQASWGAMVVWNSTVQLKLVSTYPPKAFNVALVITAIGKYTRFIPKLFETADRYFLPSQNVTYVIFTDKTAEIQALSSTRPKVTLNESNFGWPRNSLMRFAFILKYEEILKQFNFVYTLDADSLLSEAVDSEILSFRVGVLHAYQFYTTRRPFTYDTNPYSTAYVNIAVEGEYYFTGALFGGCTQEILHMSRTIQKNIEKDLERNYVALWHDESHVNRYFIDNPPSKILAPEYDGPQESTSMKHRIMHVPKNKAEIRNYFDGKLLLLGVAVACAIVILLYSVYCYAYRNQDIGNPN